MTDTRKTNDMANQKTELIAMNDNLNQVFEENENLKSRHKRGFSELRALIAV